MEQFEDDPLEFVRLDLSLSATGVDLSTRRHAAADLLQALVSSGYEAQATEIVGNWIGTGLQEYRSNKEANWRAKDSAIFLLAAVATRGSTTKVTKLYRWRIAVVLMYLNTARSHVNERTYRYHQVFLRERLRRFTSRGCTTPYPPS